MAGAIWLVMGLGLAAISIWFIPRYWVGTKDLKPGENPFSPDFVNRNLRYALPLISIWFAAAGIFLGCLQISGFLARTASDIAAVAMIVLLPLIASLFLLNRPRILVPPRFRSEPGALGEAWRWFHRRRSQVP
jgi:hypothetical protein